MTSDVKIGIYKIENTESKKVYVGSSCHIQKRWVRHRKDLHLNRHHSVHLQRAWAEYGSDKFVFEILESLNTNDALIEREQYWMDLLKAADREHGYNMERFAGKRRDYKVTEETRAKLSVARKGRPVKPPTDETREKIRRANTGKKQSLETIAKRVAKVRGKRWTQEQKDRVRGSKSGDKAPASKLTWDEVRGIRELFLEGEFYADLAARFGVSRKNVWSIVNNRIWVEEGAALDDSHKPRKLSVKIVRNIRKHKDLGILTQKELALLYGVSRGLVQAVMSNKIWQHVAME